MNARDVNLIDVIARVSRSVPKAIHEATKENRPQLIDTEGITSYVWDSGFLDNAVWMYLYDDPVIIVYPDGTVSLLSRDEDEVVEFRMLYELQR